MAKKAAYKLEQKPLSISRDEMNLAEFPLTVLSTRVNPKVKTLEYKDIIRTKEGRTVHREWIITGADKFGLPTSSDDEVLLGLLKLTFEKEFSRKKVFFTRYELLKILKWKAEGKNYTRLEKALDRLSSVRIKAKNAFYDNSVESNISKNFGIIDTYKFSNTKKGSSESHQHSYFIWSEEIFNSFKSGFIKKIDLDYYLDLKSAVSRRIYRYLDKKFWYQSKLSMNLLVFAHEKIGISRNYKYASAIKQQLQPGLDELIDTGFLANYSFEGRGQDTKINVTYIEDLPISQRRKAKKLPDDFSSDNRIEQGSAEEKKSKDPLQKIKKVAKESQQVPLSIYQKDLVQEEESLENKLLARGLKQGQIPNLMAAKDELQRAKIAKIIKYFDYLVSSNSKLISRSPIGFLYNAVKNSDTFNLPENYNIKENLKARVEKELAIQIQKKKEEELEKKYEQYVQEEVNQELLSLDPKLLKQIRKEVEEGLSNMRNTISPSRFENAVEFAVRNRVAKLISVAEYQEWKSQFVKSAAL